MERVKVTRNYQITIPSAIRETLGIKEGDVLEVHVEGDKIVIRKVKSNRPRIRLNRPVTLEYVEESVERNAREGLG